MDAADRDYHVQRIASGVTAVRAGGRTLLAGVPSGRDRVLAAEVHREALRDASFAGLLTEADAVGVLRRAGLWRDEDEAQYEALGAKLDDLKVGLYEAWARSDLRAQLRQAIKVGRDEHARLHALRHSLDHATADSVAAAARLRYLVGSSLSELDGTPYWARPHEDWGRPDDVLEEAIEGLLSGRLSEADMREVARTEPWRSIWSAGKHAGGGVLGGSGADLLDEQRSLLLWSAAYDSIREHPDCPGDDVIEDDDMIDGWMILQRRKREADMLRKQGEEALGGNARIRNAQEVYLVAGSMEDARRIGAINDATARQNKRRRMEALRARKEVNEMQMPDTAERLRMEATRAISQRMGR